MKCKLSAASINKSILKEPSRMEFKILIFWAVFGCKEAETGKNAAWFETTMNGGMPPRRSEEAS